MNLLRTATLLWCGVGRTSAGTKVTQLLSSKSAVPKASGCFALHPGADLGSVFQPQPWGHQQVRTVKRGTEYQPKNLKRKRTHGWIKRISTRNGIEVILRRMLKGRKSLSH
ncbi:39S ribosomal protein L34, mitochondrial-like [Arapaima gigas]